MQTTPAENAPTSGGWQVYCGRRCGATNAYENYYSTTAVTTDISSYDTSGTVRIVRTGTTISCYHGGSSTADASTTDASYSADCYVSLQLVSAYTATAVRWNNFQSNSSKPTIYSQTSPVPSYTSSIFDSGQTGTVTWGNFNFTGTVPTGTTLQFQVAASSSPTGPFSFVGPLGTTTDYFTATGTAIHTGTTGRYMQYKAYLTPNTAGTATPSFSAVSLSYSLTGSSTSAQYSTY